MASIQQSGDTPKDPAAAAEAVRVMQFVGSVDDLKAMKQAADRTRDLADLEDLDAAGS